MEGSYQFQLEQVRQRLEKDPENKDLLTLESNLEKLLQICQKQAPAAKIVARFRVGQTVLAKWKDGKFYEAVVASFPSPKQVSVVYAAFGSTQLLKEEDVRDFDSALASIPKPSNSRHQKPRKNLKEKRVSAPKRELDNSQDQQQQQWQSFAQKVKRKRT